MIKLNSTSSTNKPPQNTNYNFNTTNASTWILGSTIIRKQKPLNGATPEVIKASTSTKEHPKFVDEFNKSLLRKKEEQQQQIYSDEEGDMLFNDGAEKPFVCRNCNRNYKWKNSLKCHLKNECGVPPKYKCKCGYTTNIRSNLKRHYNTKMCKIRYIPKGERFVEANTTTTTDLQHRKTFHDE